jgi:hypothetical protein
LDLDVGDPKSAASLQPAATANVGAAPLDEISHGFRDFLQRIILQRTCKVAYVARRHLISK